MNVNFIDACCGLAASYKSTIIVIFIPVVKLITAVPMTVLDDIVSWTHSTDNPFSSSLTLTVSREVKALFVTSTD